MSTPKPNKQYGAQLISVERKRQIDEEKWTAKHDDSHVNGELAMAACCYASPSLLYEERRSLDGVHFLDPWPWDADWDKRPYDGNVLTHPTRYSRAKRIDLLVKAGALIAAEIDRLLRAKGRKEPDHARD